MRKGGSKFDFFFVAAAASVEWLDWTMVGSNEDGGIEALRQI